MIRLEWKKPSGFRPEYVFTRIPEREAGRLFIFGRIPPCRSYMAVGMNTLMPEMIWPIFKFLSYLAWATLKSIQR